MVIVDYFLNPEDDESGIFANSFVTGPAHFETDLEVFNEEKEYKMEKNIVHAPLMIPDRLMERETPELGLHYGRFTKESIEELHIEFMKSGNIDNVNAQHDKEDYKKGVYLIEIYIVGNRNSSDLFSHLPDGTLMGSYYVENEDMKKRIESGEFNGFSIELKNPIRRVQEEIFRGLTDNQKDLNLERQIKDVLSTDCLPDKIKEDLIKSIIKEFDV